MYNLLIKLVSGVVYAINNKQNIEITETQETHSTNAGKSNNSKIRYITNIKYTKTDITENIKSSNTKVYNMDAWEVRGHWKHYQNGTKTWVDSYVKGDKEKLNNNDVLYKLNKINLE